MSTQDMSSTFSRNDTNMVIFESIDDSERQYGEFGDLAPAPAPPEPAPAPEELAPAPIRAGIILARVHGIDEDVHAFVRDIQVGEETLVMNPILNAEDGTDEEGVLDGEDNWVGEECSLEDAEANVDVQEARVGLQDIPLVNPTSPVSVTPDSQLETGSEQEIHILDQIRSTPDIDTKFTATIGSFDVTPPQPANTVMSTTTPTTGGRLVEPALVAVNRPPTAARVLEKADGESVEEPARKRQTLENDLPSTLNEAGPSEAQA